MSTLAPQTHGDLFDIAGRRYLVTGAGHGLGRIMAQEIAARGASVVVAARTESELDETVALISASGGRAFRVPFDAQDRNSCDQVLQQSVTLLGALDGMVLNHGIGHGKPITDLTDEEFDKVLRVNLHGCFFLARAFGKHLIGRGAPGTIVLTSSTAAVTTFTNLLAYGTSKAAATQLIRQIAVEWGSHGIRANAIAPGYMTHMMKGTADRYTGDDVDAWVEKLTPLRRRGDPRELLGALIYFLSDASSFTTGQVISVDGGYTVL